MKWYEITVYTLHEAHELICDIFFENGGNGVAVLDNQDVLELISNERSWDYLSEELISDNKTVLVKGFVPYDNFEEKLRIISNRLDSLKKESPLNLGSLEIISREIDDDDWINIWKKHYKPIHIKNVTICPVWIDYRKNREDETIVKIEPGMAFGTGEHETTNLCIELMQDYAVNKMSVIDIGCGSGILGITACLLNCKSCYMTDFDPVAKTAAQMNAKFNNVDPVIKCGNLLDDTKITADLIFINIVADVLINLSFDIGKHLNENGVIILSGIINSRAQEVILAYEAQGFTLDKKLIKGEWTALSFKK